MFFDKLLLKSSTFSLHSQVYHAYQDYHHLNEIQDTLFPTRKIALWLIKAGERDNFTVVYFEQKEELVINFITLIKKP